MKAYRDWVVRKALPFWSSEGFDRHRGRFRERLDLNGRPLDVPHRVMLQARQIYVFAHAARLTWCPEGQALSETAMATLLRTYRKRAGGTCSFAFSADAEGEIVSHERDAYAHAFVLFALAALYRLNADSELLAAADETIAFIDANMIDPAHGGLFDTLPIQTRDKRQNPLMHLLEAYLSLEQAAPDRGYLDRAAGIVALVEQRLFRAERGILPEYFAADWSLPAEAKNAVFEPGHHFEWVWLLHEFARLSGRSISPAAAILYGVGRHYGSSRSGLIWDELSADFAVTKASHRLWPHTEAIKAAVARHLAGDAEALEFAGAMESRLLETFLDRPFAGGWIDRIGADGASLSTFVPASSLYHLFLAAVETERVGGGALDHADASLRSRDQHADLPRSL